MKKITLIGLSAVVLIALLGCEDAAKKSVAESSSVNNVTLHKGETIAEVKADVGLDETNTIEDKKTEESNSTTPEVTSTPVSENSKEEESSSSSSSSSSESSSSQSSEAESNVENMVEKNDKSGCQVYNPITGGCED